VRDYVYDVPRQRRDQVRQVMMGMIITGGKPLASITIARERISGLRRVHAADRPVVTDARHGSCIVSISPEVLLEFPLERACRATVFLSGMSDNGPVTGEGPRSGLSSRDVRGGTHLALCFNRTWQTVACPFPVAYERAVFPRMSLMLTFAPRSSNSFTTLR
jgi:hypothetical protein